MEFGERHFPVSEALEDTILPSRASGTALRLDSGTALRLGSGTALRLDSGNSAPYPSQIYGISRS